MKALSIKQPWAWLIAKDYKDIENRSWPTNYRGRIYIHASMSRSDMNYGVILWIKERLTRQQREDMAKVLVNPGLCHGGIIGEIDIVNCVTKHDSEWFEGPYGFVLANPVLYETPIPYKGQLGFFEVDLSNFKEVKA